MRVYVPLVLKKEQSDGLTSTCTSAEQQYTATSTGIMSKQENQPSYASPTPPSTFMMPPVFPPLPPLPPPEVSKLPNSTRKASSPPVPDTQNEPRSRKFGVRITNMLNTRETENTSPSSVAMAAAQRYYHQCQYFPHFKPNKSCVDKEMMKNPKFGVENKGDEILPENANNKGDRELPRKSNRPPQPSISSLKTTHVQPGRTIWSVTPEELAELAKEMAVTRKEPARKLSYAEASKRNLPENVAVKKKEAVEAEQPARTFKKYYGLPIIPSSEPWHSAASDTEALEEKDIPPENGDTDSEDKAADTLNYSRIFGLSADTPTFYPRQNTDTNDLIQMLKASLASKKVAPHMDWWPGDWKCTNCGNHNFSYRDTCKRCRVGRLEDAGFVFPPSPADSSA